MTLANEYWFGASAGFFPETINQSLRFEDGDSAHLIRTPSSAGDRKTFTISFWTKRANIGIPTPFLFDAYNSSTENSFLRFNSDDTLRFSNEIASSIITTVVTSQVFRDTTNWYHIVLAVDTTQSTASDRVKMYVNGQQITSFSSTDYPSLNENTSFNNTVQHAINRAIEYSRYYDGYMAEVNFIDGSVLTPSSFGETKNGVWIPKPISGLNYGTNGYRLTFADSSALGDDTSGNGNDFTSSGLASTDVVLDSPTNNFSTLSNLHRDYNTSSFTKEGNLQYVANSTGVTTGRYGSMAMNQNQGGKYYAECKINTYANGSMWIGVIRDVPALAGGIYTAGVRYKGYSYKTNGNKTTTNNTGSSYGASFTSGDIIGIALNLDDDEITFYKNGVTQGVAFTSITAVDTNDGLFVFGGDADPQNTFTFNFGQDSTFAGSETAGGNSDANGIGDFKYSVPTGYLALCSSNLPDTTLSANKSEQADDHFNTVLYTGNGTADRAIDVGFATDWFWVKQRSGSNVHQLTDTSRGALKGLNSDQTSAENTFDSVRSFTSTGVTVGTSATTNSNGGTYVAWNWKAGGTTPTKTYKVVVVSDSGNKYRFRNSADSATFAQSAVALDLQEGGTYVFDWSDSSAQGHPFRFSTTSDGTHGGGSEYTTGVVKDDSAYTTTITVASSAPQLYYYCSIHSGMGGSVNTNTTHGSTNFDGSILSVEQANTTAGFSISTYTGTGSLATVGHGLGSTVQWVIIKKRSASGNWVVGHHKNGFNGQLYFDSGAFSSNSGSFNNTAPTSTVVTINTDSTINTSSATYVMYCFTEIEGYSKFGSYTGNGSTDGSYIFTSFRPSFIMVKRTNGAGHWLIFDNKRNGFNSDSRELKADSNSAETDFDRIDFLSNGFKQRFVGTDNNGSSDTYIYMAFAEQPFKLSNAR